MTATWRFNGAATSQSRKRRDKGRSSPGRASFNGAATSQSRKRDRHVLDPGNVGASMGPRPLSHGNRGCWQSESEHLSGFNGAATSQSRKLEGMNTSSAPKKALQWGRDLSVTETTADEADPTWFTWLQWGRDLSVTETRSAGRTTTGSMSLQWGRDLSVTETGKARTSRQGWARASMGPRPLSHGNSRRA